MAKGGELLVHRPCYTGGRREVPRSSPWGVAAEHREEAGITPDKRVAFYCGTGWRAAETWFYALRPRISVYDGGWFEWSQDPLNNPIETGELEDEAAA